MTPRYVLDTNIFTALLRHEPHTLARVIRATQDEVDLLLCPIVFYEVYRGLRYRDARQQLDFFLNYVTTFIRDEFNSDDWQQAGQLWADLRRQGQQISDADLLIGVYAIQRQAMVVTDNEKHFIPLGVTTENWRR